MSGKAVMGRMMIVRNSMPKPNASGEYSALWVEDESGDGGTERCLFFRIRDALEMPVLSFPASLEVEPRMKEGRLYPMHSGASMFYAVRLTDLNGRDCVIRMTERKLHAAERLARSNEEDIPERGWWNDLRD